MCTSVYRNREGGGLPDMRYIQAEIACKMACNGHKQCQEFSKCWIKSFTHSTAEHRGCVFQASGRTNTLKDSLNCCGRQRAQNILEEGGLPIENSRTHMCLGKEHPKEQVSATDVLRLVEAGQSVVANSHSIDNFLQSAPQATQHTVGRLHANSNTHTWHRNRVQSAGTPRKHK